MEASKQPDPKAAKPSFTNESLQTKNKPVPSTTPGFGMEFSSP